MEQKSDDEATEKQPADSPSKQRKQPADSPSKQESKEQRSGDGVSVKQPAESPSKSESNGEAEKKEHDTETQATPSDKRKLDAKEQKYEPFSAVSARKMSVALSPIKRKRTETHVVALEKIEPSERQLRADEPKPGISASGVVMQGSPKHSPMKPGTSGAGIVMQGSSEHSPTLPGASAAGVVMQGSPERSPAIRGTSAAGVIMQGSPMRSPMKRTYKERQLTFNVDELVEKRPREQSGYQSDSALDLRKDQGDSALDLRKDFKKQMPSSTQSPELDCQPSSSSSDKMGGVAEKRPEERYATQSNFPRDPKSAASEVTSSDGGESDVSSTSKERVMSTTGGAASSVQGRQVQNLAESKNKTSLKTSPQHSGARPKESAGGSRSVEYISVSYPRFSPSKRFYGEPTITRISPQRAGISGSGSGGGFKVPPPPPPLEERDKPAKITNALDSFHSMIEDFHALVTAEQLQEQMRREQEERVRRELEQIENFARAKAQAAETTRKLREREARAKEVDDKSASAEKKMDIAPDEVVAGPSTSGQSSVVPPRERKAEVEEPLDKSASLSGKKEHKTKEPVSERGNLPAAASSMSDENANIMVGASSACEDDNANKSEPCTVQTSHEETKNAAKESKSGEAAQSPQNSRRNTGYLSLQQLVPEMNEISLDDSLENIAIRDSEEEDNVDLMNL